MTIQQLQAFTDSNPEVRPLINVIVDYIQANPAGAGSTPAYIPATLNSYASNTLAVAAIGVGKLYKSTTLINGSPIILITV